MLPADARIRVRVCGERGGPVSFFLPASAEGGRREADLSTNADGSYLVDPASSHMLVSKIKPCMCKYELVQTVKLRMAH